MSDKDYCMLCGNNLDPKIHITKFGKSSKEMAKIQIDLLKSLIREVYYRVPPESAFHETGIIESIMGDLYK